MHEILQKVIFIFHCLVRKNSRWLSTFLFVELSQMLIIVDYAYQKAIFILQTHTYRKNIKWKIHFKISKYCPLDVFPKITTEYHARGDENNFGACLVFTFIFWFYDFVQETLKNTKLWKHRRKKSENKWHFCN